MQGNYGCEKSGQGKRMVVKNMVMGKLWSKRRKGKSQNDLSLPTP